MSTLQETHDAEVEEKGWSGWGVLALGACYTVFPSFGSALLSQATNDEERRIAELLIDFSNESDCETLEAEREFWKKRETETHEVFSWFSSNPERAFAVTDARNRRVLSYIGDSLVYFGEHTKSFPGIPPYDSTDQGWKRWSEDCINTGRVLAAEDVGASKPAFDFLREWFWHLWS